MMPVKLAKCVCAPSETAPASIDNNSAAPTRDLFMDRLPRIVLRERRSMPTRLWFCVLPTAVFKVKDFDSNIRAELDRYPSSAAASEVYDPRGSKKKKDDDHAEFR